MERWQKLLLIFSLILNTSIFSLIIFQTYTRKKAKKIDKTFFQENKTQWRKIKACHKSYKLNRKIFFKELSKEKLNHAKIDSLLNIMVIQKGDIEKKMGLKAISFRKNKGLAKFKNTFKFFKKHNKNHPKRRKQ